MNLTGEIFLSGGNQKISRTCGVCEKGMDVSSATRSKVTFLCPECGRKETVLLTPQDPPAAAPE